MAPVDSAVLLVMQFAKPHERGKKKKAKEWVPDPQDTLPKFLVVAQIEIQPYQRPVVLSWSWLRERKS
jgi:hypothetical protein